MKMKWDIIHECDEEDGTPTQWAAKIDHTKYGKYCWISDMGAYYSVEVFVNECFKELVRCKSLFSAKRWVSGHLTKMR